MMQNERHFNSSFAPLAAAVVATLLLIACQQAQEPSAGGAPGSKPAATPAAAAPATKEVYVTFEGPWAMSTDPKDPNSILLMAPKTKHHHDLYVVASNRKDLASGTYNLSFPAGTVAGGGVYDPAYFHAKIDPQNVQRVLDLKSIRYVIRLPKPDAYVPAFRYRARVGSTYPPDATTENEYATAASLRYRVSSLNGFSLSGSPDTGTFDPLLLKVDTPVIRFSVDPIGDDDPCHLHSRQAFHDLVQLVGLTLYQDFAEGPSDCHDKDPQNPHHAKAALDRRSAMTRLAALLEKNLADTQEAEVQTAAMVPSFATSVFRGSARNLQQRLLAALYFFGSQPVDCKGVIIGDD
jgi:hypothetical protein